MRKAAAAESPGDAVPTQDQVRPMLQALLAVRDMARGILKEGTAKVL